MDYSKLPQVAFTRESLRVLVPQDGPVVYRLLGAHGELIYVGATTHPRSRLCEHLRDDTLYDLRPFCVSGQLGARKRDCTVFVALQFCRNPTQMARLEKQAQESENPIIKPKSHQRHGTWNVKRKDWSKPTKGLGKGA